MKILIMSDNHGRTDNAMKALRKEMPLDMLIHCGDAEDTEGDLGLFAECPMYCVKGNNDFFTTLRNEQEVEFGKYRAMITHGHNYRVSLGYEMLAEEAAARGYNYAFFGHTHRPCIETYGGVTLINPGSIAYPRQSDRKFTYIIMNVEEGKEPKIELKSL